MGTFRISRKYFKAAPLHVFNIFAHSFHNQAAWTSHNGAQGFIGFARSSRAPSTFPEDRGGRAEVMTTKAECPRGPWSRDRCLRSRSSDTLRTRSRGQLCKIADRSKTLTLFAGLTTIPALALADPKDRRRRVRRRATWRVVHGRRRLIVPTAVAVGWELAYDDRVVVVVEVHDDHVVVEDDEGKTEKIDVAKEDTKENSEKLEGSEYEAEDDGED